MAFLQSVKISSEAFNMCLTHSLTTEKEEVMGLLLGDIELNNGKNIAHVWTVSLLRRSDKRKDRVEISPEQLTAASAEAEKITEQTKRRTRVIGWYHSHPHITVLPSHVDVATQGLYQLLDPGFVGLIFSCFNETANKGGRVQMIAFQSFDTSILEEPKPSTSVGTSHIAPMIVDDYDPMVAESPRKPKSINSVDKRKIGGGAGIGAPPLSSKGEDLPSPPSYIEATKPSSSNASPSSLVEVPPTASVKPSSPSDGRSSFSSDMKEALAASAASNKQSRYTHFEVPISMEHDIDLGLPVQQTLYKLIDLQRIFISEEKESYEKSLGPNGRATHILGAIHSAAVYEQSLCRLMEQSCVPLLQGLQNRLNQNELKIQNLKQQLIKAQNTKKLVKK